MSIESVVNKYPQTVDVFLKHGLHCIGCAVAAFENIEQGATVHGIDVKKLLDDLNKAIKKKK
ncbi:hybrid cluster protein-associated redox disulfide domain [Thermoplasmatales archaeon SCGC AB-539-C06]|nr:hybrid cluster protein-associated redox disulfide domain [Thermoplasmatales archaeon SCGC AB-539-C06]